jgi:Tol biopolymer transport system component
VETTFSPGGDQATFVWNGGMLNNDDIYLTSVGSNEVRRLTSGPAHDENPTWSHDGRQIAFLRCKHPEDGCQIRVTSPLGSSDSKVSDFPALGAIAWSPDDAFLAAGPRRLPGC